MTFSRHRLHPFLLDVFTTGIAQAAVFVANIVIIGLISKIMGAVVLAEYLLVKRISAWLLSGSQIGVGVALPREIAHTSENVEQRATQYFAAAFLFTVLFVALITGLTALTADRVGLVLLGTPNRRLVYGLALLLLGSAAQTMLFGYYRGLQRMQMANLVQVSGLVVIPLAAVGVCWFHHSAAALLGATGTLLTVVSCSWAFPLLARTLRTSGRLIGDVRQLLVYGIQRVPGDIAGGALLALGPVFCAHHATRAQQSFLLVGITCLTTAGYAFSPVGVLLLAKVSRLLVVAPEGKVQQYVSHLRSAVLEMSFLLATQGLVFVRPVVRWWLGSSFVTGVPIISVLLLAMPAYMYYVALRSVIDAASTTAYNARNVVIALSAFLILAPASIKLVADGSAAMAVAIAMTAAVYTLAILTHVTVHKLSLTVGIVTLRPLWRPFVLACISLAVQSAFNFDVTKLAFVATQALNCGVLVWLLRKSQPEWLMFVARTTLGQA